MATSQNGLSANDRSLIASFVIPGTSRKIALRKGPVSVVLLDFFGFWHAEIEPIDLGQLDDWGYAERLIRGSATQLSNHASGSAGDMNATKHPLGTDPLKTLGAEKLAKIRARIPLYEGVLRSGAFYTGRKDTMHGEVDKLAKLAEIAARINTGWLAPGVRSYMTGAAPTGGAAPAPTPAPSASPDVVWVQNRLNGIGFGPIANDGIPGPKTTAAIKAFQFAAGIAIDGDFGPVSKATSDRVPAYPGENARAFQQRLKDRGWKIVVDNDWGKNSTATLKKFQAEKGLTVDGRMGPQSWTALWVRGL